MINYNTDNARGRTSNQSRADLNLENCSLTLSNEAISTEQFLDFASDAMLGDVPSQEHISLLRIFRNIGQDADFEILAIDLSQTIGMSEPRVNFSKEVVETTCNGMERLY